MPDKSSEATGQVLEPDRPHKSLHVLGRRPKTKTLVTGLRAEENGRDAVVPSGAKQSHDVTPLPRFTHTA
jgi:hypothetical protein